ncbi:uncharacterized protein F4822DRAFT_434836 [Hypoxylon trugodes]|uniref:uncharacterized protein n=1 Tax=Hypoxylon trugodes TaxID=326681 RepID=UPI00218EC752|nr:uncharacterized protein F4822DRAFT_434836 [Hypoxylon trugodes]KAI1382906.1 hypothetical protein F4822DRAFT_434836 [Hypoxylon trugodes]
MSIRAYNSDIEASEVNEIESDDVSDEVSDSTGSLVNFVVPDSDVDESARSSADQDPYGLTGNLAPLVTAMLGLQRCMGVLRDSVELLCKDINRLSDRLRTSPVGLDTGFSQDEAMESKDKRVVD